MHGFRVQGAGCRVQGAGCRVKQVRTWRDALEGPGVAVVAGCEVACQGILFREGWGRGVMGRHSGQAIGVVIIAEL